MNFLDKKKILIIICGGVAAYKSVELDDSLGGGPVQYREVQGSESDLFLTYFKKTGGIEYMDGGIDSGFHHVERDVYETRLLHLKGKRTVRVKSVPVSNASLNTGDVFILDTGLKIFIFMKNTRKRRENSFFLVQICVFALLTQQII